MTHESQMAALLTWMGWKDIRRANEPSALVSGIPPNPVHDKHREIIPSLTLDLMHDAIDKLPDLREWLQYLKEIVGIRVNDRELHFDMVALVNATKEQRLESLLKTLSLWKEEA